MAGPRYLIFYLSCYLIVYLIKGDGVPVSDWGRLFSILLSISLIMTEFKGQVDGVPMAGSRYLIFYLSCYPSICCGWWSFFCRTGPWYLIFYLFCYLIIYLFTIGVWSSYGRSMVPNFLSFLLSIYLIMMDGLSIEGI